MTLLLAVAGPILDLNVALALGLGLLAGGFTIYTVLRTDPRDQPAGCADWLVSGSLLGSLVGALTVRWMLDNGASAGEHSFEFERAAIGVFTGAVLGVGAASLAWDYCPRIVSDRWPARCSMALGLCALGVTLAFAAPPAATAWLITEPLSVATFLAGLRVAQMTQLMRG